MPDYRRSETEDIWHWCRECPKWPTFDYAVSHVRPREGRFCEECDRLAPLEDQTDEF